jgi:hypothetical protein
MSVICFVDVVDSTRLSSSLGDKLAGNYLAEFRRVGTELSKFNAGHYEGDAGDSFPVVFEPIENALAFATQLQQYYLPQECCEKPPIKLRIGLTFGSVNIDTKGNARGQLLSEAERIQSIAAPGQIIVSKVFYDEIVRKWGPEKSDRYLSSIGHKELKGFEGKHELFLFNWVLHAANSPKDGLAEIVYKHFQNASLELSNLGVNDIAQSATVIWPVVPRGFVNSIHRGQLEVIRLLSWLGWSIKVLIADCGSNNVSRDYSEQFKQKIEEYTKLRGMKSIEYVLMSDILKPRSDYCHDMHSYFQQVINNVQYQELVDINRKKLNKEDFEIKIAKSGTIDFLRPLLTIAVIQRICKHATAKSIVIAGEDEERQWKRFHLVPESSTQFGALLIPLLSMKKVDCQGQQTHDWPHWFSVQQLRAEMDIAYLAGWTVQLHAYLPAFPTKGIEIDQVEYTPDQWKDIKAFDDKINKDALANHVFASILSI